MSNINLVMRKMVVLLFSAFFFSCENDTDIGLQLQDQNVFFTDTVRIDAGTYLIDSVITSGQNLAPIGIAEDPLFGKIRSVFYFQPALIQTTAGTDIAFDLDQTYTADSAVIRLWNRSLVYYGDSLGTLTLNVHRLLSPLVSKNYDNNDEVPYNPEPLASISITLADLVSTTDSTSDILTVSIPLPKEILDELEAIEGTEDGETQEAFTAKFPGFALVPSDDSNVIFNFNTGRSDRTVSSAPPVSGLVFFFTSSTGSNNVYEFEFGTTRFSHSTSDRSNTLISSLQSDGSFVSSTQTNGDIYVQSGTGVVSRLRFPGLQALKNRASVARAEVIFEVDTTVRTDDFPFAPLLVPLELNLDGTVKRNGLFGYSYIGTTTNSQLGNLAIFNDSLSSMRLDITPYIRDILIKNEEDVGLIFASGSTLPNSTATSVGIMFNAGFNRTILRNPKLELYFTN